MSENLGGKLKNFVKSYDEFGHEIALNFDKKGETHKTTIGGCISMMLRIFLTIYFILRAKILVFNEENFDVSLMSANDLQQQGDILYNDLDMTLFFVVRKQLTGEAVFLDNVTAQYMKVVFVHRSANYYLPKVTRNNYTYFPAKQCDASDFKSDNVSQSLF